MKALNIGIASIAVAAALTGSATASSILMKSDGMYFGSDSLTARSNITSGTFYAGAQLWSEVDNPSKQHVTFCTEITRLLASPTEFTMVDIAAAPESIQTDGETGMGAYRAGLIQNLYDQYGSYSVSSPTQSAAFQIAVWEIIYEDGLEAGGSYVLDVADGDFRITGGQATSEQNGFGMSAVTLANQWLSAISSVNVTTVRGLISGDGQDQLIIIPLPAPVLMAGLGLCLVGVARRKFAR